MCFYLEWVWGVPTITPHFIMGADCMDTMLLTLITIIAVLGFIALPFAIREMWRTTDKIFFCLLASLVCVLCGFVSVMGVYQIALLTQG